MRVCVDNYGYFERGLSLGGELQLFDTYGTDHILERSLPYNDREIPQAAASAILVRIRAYLRDFTNIFAIQSFLFSRLL